MNENEKYKSIFDAIESDAEITIDTLATRRHEKKAGKIKKAVCCFGAFAVLFLGSNVASYAKTGEFWVKSAFSFKSASGVEITVEEEQQDEFTSISTINIKTDGEEKDFFEVEDEKIYFTYNGAREDITDKCSEDTYFKHEFTDEDGLRHVLIVGGTPDKAGSAEYIISKDGELVFSDVSGAVPLGDLQMASQTVEIDCDEDGYNISTEEAFDELKEDVCQYEYYFEGDGAETLEDIMPEWLKKAEEDLNIIY